MAVSVERSCTMLVHFDKPSSVKEIKVGAVSVCGIENRLSQSVEQYAVACFGQGRRLMSSAQLSSAQSSMIYISYPDLTLSYLTLCTLHPFLYFSPQMMEWMR